MLNTTPGIANFRYSIDPKKGLAVREASSLKEYHQAEAVKGHAQKVLDSASTIAGLVGRDGNLDDSDARANHVSISKLGFEFHDGVFTGQHRHLRVSGDTEQLSITSKHPNNDSSYPSGQVNRSESSYDFQAAEPRIEHFLSEVNSEQWTDREAAFQVTPGGLIVVPQESSKTTAEMAERAQQILDAAAFWTAEGQRRDNTAGDFDPAANHVVGVGVQRNDLPGAKAEQVMLGSEVLLHYGDGRAPQESQWDTFDMEIGDKEFFVAGSSNIYTTTFEKSQSQDSINLTYRSNREDNLQDVERVTWNKANGTLLFQEITAS